MKIVILAGGMEQEFLKKVNSNPSQWLKSVGSLFCGIL